jgi:peptide deformylase
VVPKLIYEIVKYGDPVLEQEGAPVTEFNDELAQLAADMFETMYAAKGVGLAAPQVGKSLRFTVVDITSGEDPDQKIVLANPEILEEEDTQTGEEGCLSIPGFTAEVKRPQRVKVRAQDLQGEWQTYEGEGLLARAFCHEVDHLHGVLFIRHLSFLKREGIKRKIKKLRKTGEW